MLIVIPYGNAYGANHLAHSVKQGAKTLCGRDCYMWSVGREAELSDIDSAFTCKRCQKKWAELPVA